MQQTGLSKREIIHLALRSLANAYLNLPPRKGQRRCSWLFFSHRSQQMHASTIRTNLSDETGPWLPLSIV